MNLQKQDSFNSNGFFMSDKVYMNKFMERVNEKIPSLTSNSISSIRESGSPRIFKKIESYSLPK